MKEESNSTQIIEEIVCSVRKKLDAAKYLKESKNSGNETTIEIFNNLLILLERLLWESLVTSVCLLYEKNWYEKGCKQIKKKKTRSLYWYIEEKKKDFHQKRAEYDSLLTKLDKYNEELNKCRKIRNKLLAHRDKEADDERSFLTEVQILTNDVETLVKIAEEVIQVDIEKIDATRGYGITKLFDLVEVLEKECPDFDFLIEKYRFK